ncbi:cytochrome c oxidase subunit 3 [Oceanibaculum nanhaiense]|uniref:cytochrome c oxidase subunit 3 n=1 Tax=Oceanibaculum nanhaiense TaxID=1909734 RepID=UPI003D299AE9
MSDAHATHQKHPYHLVDPSPWPFVGSIAAFVTAIGGAMGMHDKGYWVLFLGLALVLATMFFWWRDVIREANSGKYHTSVVQLGLRYGMILFIASEVMFFAAFFWAFFASAFYPTEVIGGIWPPADIITFDPFELPFINTLILLLSGCTVTWAHHALIEGNRRDLIRGLWLTVLLGMCFTALQAFEYSHAAFGFTDGIYASTFYMATGFHGFHVIVGTIFLAVCLIRAYQGHFTPQKHFGFEAAAWYWHFVDVVWLFLFVAIYWWGA